MSAVTSPTNAAALPSDGNPSRAAQFAPHNLGSMTTERGVANTSRVSDARHDPFYAPPPATDQASRLRQMVTSFKQEYVAPVAMQRTASFFPPDDRPVRIRKVPVVAITSGKGGVGKTSIAVNVAAALAQRHIRVTLVDADLGLANADVLCGMSPTRRLETVIEPGSPRRGLDHIAIDAPGGFKLVPGSVGVARMANLPASERAALLDAVMDLEDTADLVMFDTGAGLSEGVLGFVRFSDLATVVVTPEPTSIADAYATLKLLRQPMRNGESFAGRVGVIVNQATSEEEARRTFQRISTTCATFLKFSPELLGWLHKDEIVTDAVKCRTAALLKQPQGRFAAELRTTAAKLAREAGIKLIDPVMPEKPKGWWARVLGA